MIEQIYQMETMYCPGCIAKIEDVLKHISGVVSSEVLFNNSQVKIAFDENVVSSQQIKDGMEGIGYKILSEK